MFKCEIGKVLKK